jgi:hypothetical protein
MTSFLPQNSNVSEYLTALPLQELLGKGDETEIGGYNILPRE